MCPPINFSVSRCPLHAVILMASYVDTYFVIVCLCLLHTVVLMASCVVYGHRFYYWQSVSVAYRCSDGIVCRMWTQILLLIVCVDCIPLFWWHRMWTQFLFLIVCVRCIPLFWGRRVSYVGTDFIIDNLCPLHTVVLMALCVVCGQRSYYWWSVSVAYLIECCSHWFVTVTDLNILLWLLDCTSESPCLQFYCFCRPLLWNLESYCWGDVMSSFAGWLVQLFFVWLRGVPVIYSKQPPEDFQYILCKLGCFYSIIVLL